MISNKSAVQSAFELGFKKIYGEIPQGDEPIPSLDKRVVQYGIYTIAPLYFSPKERLKKAYELGKEAALMLKCNKRKSIRLAKVYKTEFILRTPEMLGNPLCLYDTLAFKATLNVSKEERREEC